MKMIKIAVALTGLLIAHPLCASAPVPVPNDVATAMEQRDHSYNELTTTWAINFSTATSPLMRPYLPKNGGVQAVMNLLRVKGFHGSKQQLHQFAKSIAEQQANLSVPHRLHTTTQWIITRRGQDTLIQGGYPSTISGTPPYYKELYSGSRALVVNAPDPAGVVNGLYNPSVWGTTGNAVNSNPPALDGLNISPAEFALLAGIDPLHMYNAEWSLTSATPDAWVLAGKGNESDTGSLTLTLIISRKWLTPSTLIVRADKEPWMYEWHASGFTKADGHTICTQISLRTHAAGVADVKENYSLQSVTPASAISITTPSGDLVHDYRLIGLNLSRYDVRQAEFQHKPNVVYYQWTGSFPDLSGLKKIQQQEHPGEGSPDPDGPTSMLPMVGGLACLALGVLTYRRKGKGND